MQSDERHLKNWINKLSLDEKKLLWRPWLNEDINNNNNNSSMDIDKNYNNNNFNHGGVNYYYPMEKLEKQYLYQDWLILSQNYPEERPKTTNLHRKPTSGWRRERRKDPIQSETRESIMQNEALDMSATTRVHHHHHHHHPHSRPSVIVPTAPQPGTTSEDTAKSPTPSATPSLAIGGKRTGVKSANGGSDPAIDEHFKRSLGPVDYAAVFNESIDAGGLSVDDHFKKALGPNWESLNKKDTEKLS